MDSISRSLNPNKHLKEQFVSNLTGSSMLEIAALLTTVPILVLLRHSISSYIGTDHNVMASLKKNDNAFVASKSLRAYMVTISVDFLFIVLPMILRFTVLADWTFVWAILLAILLIVSVAAKRFSFSSAYFEGQPYPFRTSISSYRVALMIITCLCILAVDFRIFPRKYAKTETYGTSLMDLGVGSFVLANSMVSRQARCVSSTSWMAALKAACPLILVGFGRLVSTAGMDYQVHVGEYGVHWNFFFTLAAISILTSIVNVPPKYSGILGSIILVGYQSLLNHGLNKYLLSAEREADIISKNKEGIFSILGYWGMYLLGVHLANHLFFGKHSSASLRSNKGVIVRVWLLSLLFWLLTVLLDNYVERVSRRMCNLAYVTWVLAQNLQVLAIFMLSVYTPGSRTSALEEAFDQNLLALFLLANMLTGLVNLSVDTLFAPSLSALLTLLAYAFTLSTVIGIVHFYGIRLKLG